MTDRFARFGTNRLLKNSEPETEKQFPCVAGHSRAGGNLSESTTYWMPAFAGMTNPVGSRHNEALCQQSAKDSGQLKNTIGHFHRKDCRHV